MGWFTYFTYRASKKYDLQFAISSVFHNKAIQYWYGDHLKGPNLTNMPTMFGQNEFRGLLDLDLWFKNLVLKGF